MKLIDSHIHLDFPAFDKDRTNLLEQALSAGVVHYVVPATTKASWRVISNLVRQYKFVSPAYGIHPYFIDAHTLVDCDALDQWVGNQPCSAVGEIGLDYFAPGLDQTKQNALFTAQLVIASNHHLPVILHARKAVEDVIHLLNKHKVKKGIVHSFNGSYVQAMRLIEMGFKLGFGGAITYPRATRLRALIKQLPLESICLETDAPDQPSQAYQGKRNSPLALLEVLDCVSKIQDVSPKEVAKQTRHNTLSALKSC